MKKLTVLMMLCAAGGALAAPVPEDKRAYVGDWEGHGITLSISESGKVTFKKASGSFSKSLSGILTGFEGNDIKMNALITTLTLRVQEPPHQDRGVWVMTVEGEQVLRKTAAAEEPATGGRRERITAAIRADLEKKGVLIKSLFCPADAESKDLFACVLTTELGDLFPVKCIVDPKGQMRFESEAALIDPAKLQAAVIEMFAKKPGGKAEVRCPAGVIMKKVGDSFGCVARAKGRNYPIKITVKDLAGGVSIDY